MEKKSIIEKDSKRGLLDLVLFMVALPFECFAALLFEMNKKDNTSMPFCLIFPSKTHPDSSFFPEKEGFLSLSKTALTATPRFSSRRQFLFPKKDKRCFLCKEFS
jgi:hypothetical protein